ncbi:MAG: sensor histidine kinase, partial [Chthoniobacteraceae bacterium]
RYTPSLLTFMGAGGAAVCRGDQCSLVGIAPPKVQVGELLQWLRAGIGTEHIFATDHLSQYWPPAADWTESASGLLAIELSRVDSHWLLWFRPEVVKTVRWAGNPEKPVEEGLRLHPRKSFDTWQQTVTGRSLPWTDAELEGARELRLALNALVIRRTEKLLRLNTELERKNSDLNSFAYIASHDLKEPLRGIFHFARFLKEDHAKELGDEGLRKVDTIATMASNTNDLLTALAHFSQLGRMELAPAETDLDALLDGVLTTLTAGIAKDLVEIRRPRKLPTVQCDPVLMREVFANLIGNAIKYNTNGEKWVEISFRDPSPEELLRGPVFIVSDNGIGIRERNFESAFQMFRRLNKDQFPEGTGAGLAITKSIVERHGGRLWVESVVGEGTTFFFTLK